MSKQRFLGTGPIPPELTMKNESADKKSDAPDPKDAAFDAWWYENGGLFDDDDKKLVWMGWSAKDAEIEALKTQIEELCGYGVDPRKEIAALRERLKHISFSVTGNDYALIEATPQQVDNALRDYAERVLAKDTDRCPECRGLYEHSDACSQSGEEAQDG